MPDPHALLDAYAVEESGAYHYGDCPVERDECAPAAFAALRAVLDVHKQHHSLDGTCVGCSEREDTYDDVPWPCPTVQAITAALEADR